MTLDILRRGERGRETYGDRVPPNQRVTDGWPVLTYGICRRVYNDMVNALMREAGLA